MRSSKLRDVTAVFAKIMEVIGWIGAVVTVISFAVILIFRDYIEANHGDEISITNFSAPGYNMENLTGSNFVPVMLVLLAFVFVTGVLMIVLFRSVNQVFKTTNTDSPFAMINVKRIKRIGYIAISFPIIKVIVNIVLAVMVKSAVVGVEASEILFGLIILCLSQYFAYGASLEKDVNGLL